MADLSDLMEKDFEEVASKVESVSTDGLKGVADIGRQILACQAKLTDLEDTLKNTKKELLYLTDDVMPSAMAELGLSSFKLDDGSMVDIKQTYGASIKVDDRPAAYQWLRENEHGDIIKNVVSCAFARGEDSKAESFIEMAAQSGLEAQQKSSVHPETLKAFVRERVENGEVIPMDLFGVWVGQRATIKRSK